LPESTLIPALGASSVDPGEPVSFNAPLLRRVDWRVLLPVPPGGFEHLLLLGGPRGLSETAVEIGLARRVSEEIPSEPSADAVAILDGTGVRWEDAAAALLPGGCLYWEVESSNPWAPLRRRIEARLRRARLSLTGLHAVLPDFERSQLVIPLSAPVVRWHLSLWGPARLEWLMRSPLGSAAASLVARRWMRHCAVTAVAWPRREAGPSILEHPALAGQGARHALVLNREQMDGTRRVIVFAFPNKAAKPSAVLKFWRLPWRNAEVTREQEAVAELRSRLDPTMRHGLPKPLGTFRWGNAVVGAEACAAGRPLSRTSTRKRSRAKNLALVARWLRSFHRQTAASPSLWTEPQIQTFVEIPLASYETAFGKVAEEGMLFERVRKRARSLVGRSVRLVQAHPAFSEFNIYRRGEDISVIDWEETELGAPLQDLIYFLTLWYYRSGPERSPRAQMDSFRRLFFPAVADPLAALASAALRQQMQDLSLDPDFLPIFLVTTWVVRAEDRLQRARLTRRNGFDPRRGNLHVERVQVLAENRDLLLPEPRC
jgi:phosphotransferase family enzyme